MEKRATNLHLASDLGLETVISRILAGPSIDITAVDHFGLTALSLGYKDIVGQLLAAPRIDIKTVNNNGCTALFFAGIGGYNFTVSQVLAAENINATDNYC